MTCPLGSLPDRGRGPPRSGGRTTRGRRCLPPAVRRPDPSCPPGTSCPRPRSVASNGLRRSPAFGGPRRRFLPSLRTTHSSGTSVRPARLAPRGFGDLDRIVDDRPDVGFRPHVRGRETERAVHEHPHADAAVLADVERVEDPVLQDEVLLLLVFVPRLCV